MNKQILTAATVFAALPLLAAANGLRTVSSLDRSTVPAAVPGEYVVTPFGYFHPSCTQEVGIDETLQQDGSILGKDGAVRQVAKCTYASFLRDGTRIEPNDESNSQVRKPTTYNGYLQLVSATLSSAANELTADMKVPPNPTEQSGQTLYIFPGLEDAQHVVTILQPVLGWDGYGANNWTIASWNCCKSGTTYVGNNVVVQPGDVIAGSMLKGTGQNWTVTATDTSNSSLAPATLAAKGYLQKFDWIFAGALETYGVTDCNQFPASGPMVFSNITTYVNKQVVSSPSWGIQSGSGSPSTCTGASVVNSTTVDITY